MIRQGVTATTSTETTSDYPFARSLSRTALILLLAACAPNKSVETPEPRTFRFPPGTVFLSDATADSAVCGTLADARDGTRINLVTYSEPHGTAQQTFGGYNPAELGICPNDSDGIIWHDEGLFVAPVPPIH